MRAVVFVLLCCKNEARCWVWEELKLVNFRPWRPRSCIIGNKRMTLYWVLTLGDLVFAQLQIATFKKGELLPVITLMCKLWYEWYMLELCVQPRGTACILERVKKLDSRFLYVNGSPLLFKVAAWSSDSDHLCEPAPGVQVCWSTVPAAESWTIPAIGICKRFSLKF